MTHGTWQTTGGGGSGGPPVGLVVLVLVAVVGAGAVAGIAQAVAQAAVILLTAVAVFVMAAVAGAVAYVIYRRRTGRPLLPSTQSLIQLRELNKEAVRPFCLPPAQPKALPQPTAVFIGGQHVHVQPGADLSALTEALRTRDAITVEPEG